MGSPAADTVSVAGSTSARRVRFIAAVAVIIAEEAAITGLGSVSASA